MPDKSMSTDLQSLWEELTQPEEEQRDRIRRQRFNERAQDYSTLPIEEQTYTDDEVYRVLTFHFGDEYYGIDVDIVTGVRPAEQITRVPAIPAFYKGVINVRAKIISVLDLRLFFGLSPSESKKSELILVKIGELSLALLADHIEEVKVIPRNTVEMLDRPYIRGVTANKLIILDTDYLQIDDRLIIGGKS
ncbi:MAG: hypothetical protein Phog2KO_23730 [Phototrophicaceae bacterium]